jgi:hypothetical protein
MPKFEPMEFKLNFQIPTAQLAGTHFLDVGQVASLTSRKFIRQGQEFLISNIEIVSDGDTVTQLSRLPTNWCFYNAWVAGFEAWQEQQDSVLDDQPSLQSRYRDFKIFYDSDHEQLGFGANLLPYGYDIAFALDDQYDWDHTNIEIPTDGGALPPVRFNLHAIGATTASSKSLIQGYALSRSRPQQEDPNVPLYGGWLQSIKDVAEIDPYIRQDLYENNTPPYPVAAADGVNQNQEFYPGGNQQAPSYQSFMQDILITRSSTALAMDSTGPFSLPCGLLRLDIDHPVGAGEPTTFTIILTLTSGSEKGLAAVPMQDVN